jgi:hypothetical protein
MDLNRIDSAIEKAKSAFWASITESFPEVTKGYLDPLSVNTFDASVEKVINEWLYFNSRLFSGVFPTSIVYADKYKEVHGDYKRCAYLNFKTLVLDIEKDCPEVLKTLIIKDAGEIQAKKGENFQVSFCGQSVKLGE